MLIIFLNLLVWIPSVAGYGIVLFFLRKRLSVSADRSSYEVLEPIFGMMVLSTLANFLNFFSPIHGGIAVVLLVIGWGLFWLRFFRLNQPKISSKWLVSLLVWMLFVSFWATQTPRNPDSGLYHMQSIRWLNDSALPLGLANLHQRLGFNSSWFSFASILKVSYMGMEGSNCVSVSAILIYFFGIAVGKAFISVRTRQSPMLQHLFLSLSVLILLGSIIRRNISSPSPDLAVFLLSIIVAYSALDSLMIRSDWAYRCFQLITVCLFSLTIKFSSLPLLFIPLSLLIFGQRNRIPISWKVCLGYSFFITVGIFAFWAARGIGLSGCVAFPLPQTCIPNFSWSIPYETAKDEWLWDQSWARLPAVSHDVVLADWKWLRPWFERLLSSVDFVMFLLLLGAGSVFLMISTYVLKKHPILSLEFFWMAAPLCAGIIFWFLTAPDVRFGAGYFWCLGILTLSFGINNLSRLKASTQKTAYTGLLIVLLLVLIPHRGSLYFGLPPIRKAFRDPQQFFFALPIPKHETEIRLTMDGIPIYVANTTKYCWLSDLPCTPYFNKSLGIVKSADGQFIMFYSR